VGEAGKKKDDWWDPSRTLLANAGDLQNFMLTYDKENIPESLIAKIKPYIDDERHAF
jgi:dynein heavy chain